jgi:hypothetical protein
MTRLDALREGIRGELGECFSEARLGRIVQFVLNWSSQDHEPHIGSVKSTTLALNGCKAAWPVINRLIAAEYNVETWGLKGRLAAIDAALSSAEPEGVARSRDTIKIQDPIHPSDYTQAQKEIQSRTLRDLPTGEEQ